MDATKPAMKFICAFFAALTVLLVSHDGFGQSAYPDKAIRILVGFPPGGPPDITARLLADKFAEVWSKPVVVENATGAGGNVAVDRTAKATPDGYTLVMASSAITINPSLYEKLPYDPVKDLAPISVVRRAWSGPRDGVIGPEFHWSHTYDFEIIRELEALLGSLSFLAPRGGVMAATPFFSRYGHII
jgi:hypothetical protein